MDDKHIEQMVRDSWKPEPPNGMRERVLRRARGEMKPRRAVFGMSRLSFAFVSICMLVVLFTGISDSARQSRMSITGNGSPSLELADREDTWLKLNREWASANWLFKNDPLNGGKGDDIL